MANPYIDFSLLRCQSQFSIAENERFERRHTIKLQPSKSAETHTIIKKENKLFLKFKWSEHIKSKYECDTKHFLYLIYVSLIKVEERQKFKNKYYLQMSRGERVLPLLDKEQIMTNLIAYYNRDTINNELNGQLFEKLGPKEFINNVLTKYGGSQCTLGWSTKIYAKLNEICVGDINGDVFLPNYEFNEWNMCSSETSVNS